MKILKNEKLKILLIAFIAIFSLFAISANTNVKAEEGIALQEEIWNDDSTVNNVATNNLFNNSSVGSTRRDSYYKVINLKTTSSGEIYGQHFERGFIKEVLKVAKFNDDKVDEYVVPKNLESFYSAESENLKLYINPSKRDRIIIADGDLENEIGIINSDNTTDIKNFNAKIYFFDTYVLTLKKLDFEIYKDDDDVLRYRTSEDLNVFEVITSSMLFSEKIPQDSFVAPKNIPGSNKTIFKDEIGQYEILFRAEESLTSLELRREVSANKLVFKRNTDVVIQYGNMGGDMYLPTEGHYIYYYYDFAPYLSNSLSQVTMSYSKIFEYEHWEDSLNIEDPYYTLEELTINIQNNYVGNETKIGEYEIIFNAENPDGNILSTSVKIIVVDDVAPEFTATIDTYTKSTGLVKSINDILAYFAAKDEIDGAVDVKVISDEFTGNGNKAGTYDVVVGAEDAAGNLVTHNVQVVVKNHTTSDWVIIDNEILILTNKFEKSRAEIVTLLADIGLVEASALSVTTYHYDSYTDNMGREGIYRLEFNVTEATGTTNDYKFVINIGNVPLTDTEVIPPKVNPVSNWLKANVVYFVLIAVGAGVVIYYVRKKK